MLKGSEGGKLHAGDQLVRPCWGPGKQQPIRPGDEQMAAPSAEKDWGVVVAELKIYFNPLSQYLLNNC